MSWTHYVLSAGIMLDAQLIKKKMDSRCEKEVVKLYCNAYSDNAVDDGRERDDVKICVSSYRRVINALVAFLNFFRRKSFA